MNTHVHSELITKSPDRVLLPKGSGDGRSVAALMTLQLVE
jgi:hypothetical protein